MGQTITHVGDTFNAGILNNILYYLQQPAGGQETGKYIIENNSYDATTYLSCCIITWSRNTVPVSASVDTADNGMVGTSGLGAINAGHLTMGGMQIYAQATAAGGDSRCGGNWTMQY